MFSKEIAEIDWARLAAFIDGEGCIAISRYVKGRPRSRYQLVLNITNTDPRLLIWLGKFGEASFLIRDVPGQRPRHTWTVASKRAVYILRNCLPYFVMKRDQAELAIAFQETKKYWGQGGHVPENLLLRWDEMYQDIHDLKTPPVGKWMGTEKSREWIEKVQ